MLNIAKYNN